MLKRKTVKIGDVFQILSSGGVSYGTVARSNEKSGSIVAIFREFYDKTPNDFNEVVYWYDPFDNFDGLVVDNSGLAGGTFNYALGDVQSAWGCVDHGAWDIDLYISYTLPASQFNSAFVPPVAKQDERSDFSGASAGK